MKIFGYTITKEKRFPNGFVSWYETFFELTNCIRQEEGQLFPCGLVASIHDEQGFPGMYDFAAKLTDEFEKLHAGYEWDGEFIDEIEYFFRIKNEAKEVSNV